MFLVTTANQKFWKKDTKVLFLGEWCKIYSQRHVWSGMDYQVLPYHWDDRKKLHKDFLYLDELCERYLPVLAGELNSLHGVNYSSRYWRILIGPWLILFIQILYDRYLSVSAAIDTGKVTETWVAPSMPHYYILKDYATLIRYMPTDEYNQYLYGYLIKSLRGIPFQVKNETLTLPSATQKNEAGLTKITLIGIRKVLEWYRRMIPDRWNEVVFVGSYLNLIDQARLQLSLGQFPCRIAPTVVIRESPVDLEMRRALKLSEGKNQFEKLLDELIPINIFRTCVEGYSEMNEISCAAFPKRPRVIYTTNALYYYDAFKFWTASHVEHGVKLIVGQHGGNYGAALWSSHENHENRISDMYVSWGWKKESDSNILPLPSGQLSYVSKKIRPDPSGSITLIPMTLPRYSYWLYSFLVGPQIADYIKGQEKFVDALSIDARSFLEIRSPLNSYEFGWSTYERWKDFDPKIKIRGPETSLYKLLCGSRLSVCTYNATTILEVLAANFPTIIFWDPNFFELRDSAQPYYDELRKVSILHDTPKSAAIKVNEVYEDPMAWWGSPDVQMARKNFCRRFAWTSPGWISDWKKEFEKLITR
jgi:putative transferase (TIGR04331 family)